MRTIGESFIILQSVESTNNYAMAQVHAGLANHGDTYFALEQTAGKGQRGKSWKSRAGENIVMSVILEPGRLILSEQFLLSVGLALACYDLMSTYAGPNTKLKWPNDIYLGDRKAGGILIENILQGTQWQYAIAGFGLNINQTRFAGNIPNAVSLKQVSENSYDVMRLAKELCDHVEKRLGQIQNHQKVNLLDEYNSVLYKRDETVRLKRNNIVFDALIKGVSNQGGLLIQSGVAQEFEWGEVEWVI